MKMFEFQNVIKFHWSVFLRDQLTYSCFGLDNVLVRTRWQAIVWTNDGYMIASYMHQLASKSWIYKI